MSERVIVIGSGISGVCAAIAAKQAGFDVRVVSRAQGASVLHSGALDWEPWSTATTLVEPSPESSELETLLPELSLRLGKRLLVTGAGIVRPAAGSDRWLLDLMALPTGAVVGVVVSNWVFDRGEALLAGLQADPRAAGRAFTAVVGDRLFAEDECRLPLAALGERFTPAVAERVLALAVQEGARGVAALLVGPYLGCDPAALAILERAPIPIGETTSPPDGSAGRRMELGLQELLRRRGIALTEASVVRVREGAAGIVVTLGPGLGGSSLPDLEADRVVLATGGLIGGGLVLGTGAGQGIGSPLLDGIGSSGSRLGWDAASDGGSWLRPGIGPGLGREHLNGRVIAVGDVRAGAAQTFLAAARDGLSALRK